MSAAADTILAVATPAGAGAVGILRVSGPSVAHLTRALAGILPAPRRATLRSLRAADGTLLDRALVLYFPGPGSYTGEDMVEFHTHGSPVVLRMLQDRLTALGARAARPGEFSERAFLAGKIDLSQAEAIADLIAAGSQAAARAALRSLEGQFAAAVEAVRAALLDLRVRVEADIDFSEDEAPQAERHALRTALQAALERLAATTAAAERGRALARGLEVVIVGQPNVGKSSLLNLLAGADHAIVSPVPGTTRDLLHADLTRAGLSVRLLDTAGQRTSEDPLEREGVRRARAALARADHALLVTDAARPVAAEDLACLQGLPAGAAVTLVRNKIDLLPSEPTRAQEQGYPSVALSATTGAGLELLEARLLEAGSGGAEAELSAFGARTRHLDGLARARSHIEAALAETAGAEPALELLAEQLRLADRALGELTGAVGAEELLGFIFSTFCIGK